MTKRALAFMLAAVMLLSCLIPAMAETPEKKKITYMVYLCGSDLETENMAASRFLGEVGRSQYNADEVNVIALAGGSWKWFTRTCSREVLTVLNVSGRVPSAVTTFPLASMGEAETLSGFLSYCYENYPADQYILNLWDHGGGPVHGVAFDELYKDGYGNKDSLSLQELADALENSPFKTDKLDLLMMHACLMSSAEVAACVAPYADYLVASQDANYGLNYEWLKNAENTDILDIAKKIVDDTFEQDVATAARQKDTMITNSFALIDLSGMDALIGAMNDYFPRLEEEIDASSFTGLSSLRRNTTTFGVGESGDSADYDLVDLGDFVQQTREAAPDEADKLLAALETAVVYHRSVHERCSGLTVYHPFTEKRRLSQDIPVYNELNFAEGYTNYVHRFVSFLTGTSLAVWKNLNTNAKAEKDLRTLFNLALSDDQAACFGVARMEALLGHADGAYTRTFVTNRVAREGNILTAEFSGTALYAVSGDGSPLSPALDYSIAENGAYVIKGRLSREADEEYDAVTHDALIYCTLDADTKALIPGHIQVWYESMGAYTAALQIPFEEYDAITLTLEYRRETADENGTLLPFDQWELVRTEEWTGKIDDAWGFRLVNDTLDTKDLYATFRVCDSQNNFYNSSLLRVKTEVSGDGASRITYDDLGMMLIEEFYVTSARNQLMINVTLKNITDQDTWFRLEGFCLNGRAVDITAEVFGSCDNWGLMPGESNSALISLELNEGETVTEITFRAVPVHAADQTEQAPVPVLVQL